MKKLALTAGFIGALSLVGCASTADSSPTVAVVTTAQQALTKDFVCANGIAPQLTYINENQANITVDGKTTTLTIAPSGSGERYVSNNGVFGHGGEWHQKGNQAVFSYKTVHGSPAETACQAR